MTAVVPSTDVAKRYKGQFVGSADSLQHQAQQMGTELQGKEQQMHDKMANLQRETEPIMRQLAEKTQSMVEDREPTRVDAQLKYIQLMLEPTNLWSVICLLGLCCGEFLGRYILQHPMALFIDSCVSMAVLFLLLPVWFYMFNRKSTDTEDERRVKLFTVGLAAGALFPIIDCLSWLHKLSC